MRPNGARRSRAPGLLFHAVYRPRGEPALSHKARKGGADMLSPLWSARHRKARRCGRRRYRDDPILSASRPPRDSDAERRNPPLRRRGCSAAPVRLVKRQASHSAKSRGSLSWIRARTAEKRARACRREGEGAGREDRGPSASTRYTASTGKRTRAGRTRIEPDNRFVRGFLSQFATGWWSSLIE